MRAVTDAFEGMGPILPLGPNRELPAALAGWSPFGPRGWLAALPPTAAALIATSGSSGEPKLVVLSASALQASADATHAHLGGAGRWLLALPAHHIAGFQVVVRSVLAGTSPKLLPAGSFTAAAFTAAAESLISGPEPAYVSLVPTQLSRLIKDDTARHTLAGFSAVLIGGALLPASLASAAAEAGINVVHTYGMSETAGGCVYDGTPLKGVQWRLAADGRIWLSGPMLAEGYLGQPQLNASTFPVENGTRWFRTSDLGRETEGKLEVGGRIDDVIISGGVNLAPTEIENALTRHPHVTEAVVVGVPDPEWGQRVVALVTTAVTQEELQQLVRQHLGSVAVPKQIFTVDQLPTLESGKIDRAAALQVANSLCEPSVE